MACLRTPYVLSCHRLIPRPILRCADAWLDAALQTGHSARPGTALLAVEIGRTVAYHVQEESREKDLRGDEGEEEREWRHTLTEGRASWGSCGAR